MPIDVTTAEGQKFLQGQADRRLLDVCRTFNEIMTGPNPLTQDEINKLVAKRPIYQILRNWVR